MWTTQSILLYISCILVLGHCALEIPPSGLRNPLNCVRTFVKYHPSQFEKKWAKHIKSWQSDVCKHLEPDKNLVQFWISATASKQINGTLEPYTSDPLFWQVFSSFEYSIQCPSLNREIKIREPIEPLVGFIRDPVHLCKMANAPNYGLLSREFLLLMDATWEHASRTKVQLFDLGATVWQVGRFPSSQHWLYEQYVTRGRFILDRFLMWEANPVAVNTLFQSVPHQVLPYFQYYNVPVSSNTTQPHYPWSFVKALALGRDRHVVVKLDIDTPVIENALVRQLLEDEDAWRAVDEMFYEHHTNIPEMVPYWKAAVEGTLADTYAIFSVFRRRGIRMHGWP